MLSYFVVEFYVIRRLSPVCGRCRGHGKLQKDVNFFFLINDLSSVLSRIVVRVSVFFF